MVDVLLLESSLFPSYFVVTAALNLLFILAAANAVLVMPIFMLVQQGDQELLAHPGHLAVGGGRDGVLDQGSLCHSYMGQLLRHWLQVKHVFLSDFSSREEVFRVEPSLLVLLKPLQISFFCPDCQLDFHHVVIFYFGNSFLGLNLELDVFYTRHDGGTLCQDLVKLNESRPVTKLGSQFLSLPILLEPAK